MLASPSRVVSPCEKTLTSPLYPGGTPRGFWATGNRSGAGPGAGR